jgi:RNA polymerase sigma-70 factor (ECF subfamily)
MTAMAKDPEEQALVERFRRGDDSAFDRIVERHSAEIAALADRLLAWPQDVDDIVQEVFIAAFVGLKKFRGDSRLRTWLFTITINKCRSHRQRWRSRRRRMGMVGAEADPRCDGDAARAALADESCAEVRRAVGALPQKYREVVVLRYLEGLGTDEICDLLAITANAMQVRLNRAKKKLRQTLNGIIEEPS